MQQQQMNYDLLAVFNNESDADAAETKLHKEGFGNDEVFRLTADSVAGGQFREHGPNRDRSAVFLQTTRSGPNPVTVILFAIVFGLILGALLFGAADFASKRCQYYPLRWQELWPASSWVQSWGCYEGDRCVEESGRICQE